jgi:Tfp pilus assembly protein FimT
MVDVDDRQLRRRSAATARAGVALIDLVIATLLIGILAGAALPRFADSLQQHRARAAALRVVADLKLLRSQAIASSQSRRVDFDVPNHRYTLVSVTSADRPGTTASTNLADYPYKASLASISVGGDASLTFDMHGRPDSAGTIQVSAGGYDSTVTVQADTGEVTSP